MPDETNAEKAKIMTKPLPQILDEMDENTRLAAEAAMKAAEAAAKALAYAQRSEEAAKVAEKAGVEAAKAADEAARTAVAGLARKMEALDNCIIRIARAVKTAAKAKAEVNSTKAGVETDLESSITATLLEAGFDVPG